MRKLLKAVFSAAATALLVGSSMMAFGVTAHAANEFDGPPAESKTDRTIYINEPAPTPDGGKLVSREEDSTGQIEVWRVDDDFLPVTPIPGESVRVVYTDAVSLITTEPVLHGARAACTKSLTAHAPYKVSNTVRQTGSGTISTGCSSGDTATVGLYNGLTMYKSLSWSVANSGNLTHGSLQVTCSSTASTSLYGIARWSSGGSVWGPTVTLACRP